MKNKVLIVFFCGVSAVVYSQREDQWQQLKEKYSTEPAVFVERAEVVTIEVKSDSLVIYSDVFEDILYLKEQADVFANRRVHGSHFSQVGGIKAKTLVWDKSRHKEQTVSDFAKKFDTDDGIFYDDSYYYSFSFPSVAPRNRTQLEYRTVYKDPRFLPGYVFASYIPQEKSVFTIKTTSDVDLHVEVLNDKNNKIKFRKYAKGGEVFYEWSVQNQPPYKAEDDSPSIRYYTPHVLCYIKSYNTTEGKKEVLPDLNGLYKWYYSFLNDLEAAPSAELVTIVNGLKVPGDTEEETVRKIFYWVQDNIRYIAFEEGMRGFVPHHGSYVCEKRYGDCKDMASIIVEMLQIAGINAYHTWIGSRDLPYTYSAFPTPVVDNHMIATYISKDNKYYFLDATGSHTPFGLPTSMIQGKEALIGKGRDDFEVKLVPEISKEQNMVIDSMWLSIAGNELTGHGAASFTGYPKMQATYKLDRSRADVTEQNVAQLLNKGSNKFYLDKFTISDLTDRDKATRINYSFRIGDYFQRIGDEIYVNLNLTKDFYNEYINLNTRKTPLENQYKYQKQEVSVLEIPEGYGIDYQPENVHHESPVMGIDVTYTRQGRKVIVKKNFYLDFLLMKTEQFEAWNESVKRISDIYKESIILKKE